VAEIKKQCNK